MAKIRVLELFAGIGACSKALERLGIDHEIVDAVEIDKYAIASFNAVHGTNFEPQDITKWDKDIKVDLIMHGSPCQDFSVAGRGAGGDEGSGTRSSLLYESLRIIEKLQPKYVIWENVKNLLSKRHVHNWDAYAQKMEELGYTNYCQILNAKDYGVPQNRERVFTVSIKDVYSEDLHCTLAVDFDFPKPMPLEKKLKDILEDNVDEKYYISSAMMNYFMGVNQKPSKFPRKKRFLANINRKDQDRANSVTTNPGQRPTDNFVVVAQRGRSDGDWHESEHYQKLEPRDDGLTNTISSVLKDNYVAEPCVIGGIGEKDSNGGKQWKMQNRVYDNKVAASVTGSFRPYYKEEQKIAETGGVAIRTANKRGYDMATDGDGVDLAYPNSNTRRGRVGHGVSKTVTTEDLLGVVEYKTKNHRVIETAEKSGFRDGKTAYLDVYNGTPRPEITSTINAGTDSHQNNIVAHNYRIRKLTPKECWRLMGFDDKDFEKAEKVNSSTQLYKQAGNSIVVNVLEGILRNLLTEEKCKQKQKSISQMHLWN